MEAYPTFIKTKADFNTDLPAPDGLGSFGGNTFIRLSLKTRDEYINRVKEDVNDVLKTPLFIELPTYTENGYEFRHKEEGAYVKFFAGHIDFIPFSD